MTSLNRAEASTILNHLGWRVNTAQRYHEAVEDFQRGWALGPALTVDGKVGPVTSAALRVSEARRKKGVGTASLHFSFYEFACKCGGRYASCRRVRTHRLFLKSLEQLRTKVYPHGMSIVSGYRCPGHNSAVGGASSSQHLFGAAADIGYAASSTFIGNLGLFSGIGRSARTGLVRHVDRRDISGNNTTGASVGRPTIWNYAS